MCKVCERVDSLIEAMEKLYTVDDWKMLLLSEGFTEDDPELNDIVLTDDKNVWMNILAMVMVTWMFRKKIPLFPGMMTISQHLASIYAHRSAMEAVKAGYTCPNCGMVSHNPNDVVHKYCGNCHTFENEL